MNDLIFRLIIIFSGVTAGLIQTCISLPPLSLIVYIPLFYGTFTEKEIFEGKLKWIKGRHLFIFCTQLVSCSFLLTVYKLMPLPFIISAFLSAMAMIVLSLWLTFLINLPLVFFEKVRCERAWDILSLSMLYAAGEWLCENVPILSFPWSTVALSTVSWNEFIQSASIMGSKFTTVIILCINGFLAYAIINRKSAVKSVSCICTAVLIVSATVFFGAKHISYSKNLAAEDGRAVNIMIAQDNVEGNEKTKLKGIEAARHYLSIIGENWTDNTDIILLPETAVPENFDEQSKEFAGLMSLSKMKDVTICTGSFCEYKNKVYNAVYAITPDGVYSQPYLKEVLVPFGEKIPFAELLGKPTVTSRTDDKYAQPLKAGDYSVGCGICIESIYPSIFRNQAEKGGELFIIPTNDSWFGKSFARYAHYRHSILRAVENSRYVLRSGNCGISAVITPWGEETVSIKNAEKGAINATIHTQNTQSIYTRTGDALFMSVCLLYLTVRFFIANSYPDQSR